MSSKTFGKVKWCWKIRAGISVSFHKNGLTTTYRSRINPSKALHVLVTYCQTKLKSISRIAQHTYFSKFRWFLLLTAVLAYIQIELYVNVILITIQCLKFVSYNNEGLKCNLHGSFKQKLYVFRWHCYIFRD